MPTLLEVNITPSKAQDAKKPSTSGKISFARKDEKENDKNKNKSKSSTKDKGNKSESSTNQKHRRGGDKQLSIFESIGIPTTAGKIISPRNSAVDSSSKKKNKKRKSTALTAKDNSFPIIVHVNSEGKEPQKVVISCHGVKREFSNAIVDSPIVVEEKRAIPKDPVARFLVGFGRFIH